VPTVSPDGKHIAFSLYHEGKDSDDPASGIDLWVTNADGTGQRTVLLHHGAGEWLANGAWSPDGSSLYFTRRSPADAPRIERVRLDGSERKVVVASGERPTVSRDGRWLAYLTDDAKTGSQVLAVTSLGGGKARTLLAGLGFKAVAAPVFAPDNTRLAFVGVGGPAQSTGSSAPCCSSPLAWLGPAPASAHGVPWELWVVNVDGTGLRRLTDIREDGPFPAWSPDGRWIAFKGELGLYLLDAEGKQIRRLAQELAGEGLSWLGS
jgi:TolB protein